jgi:hypothetical protein
MAAMNRKPKLGREKGGVAGLVRKVKKRRSGAARKDPWRDSLT